jgi:hypothetical protein
MSLLRVNAGENFFELGVAIEEDGSIQSYGDAYIALKVQSEGYCGHNDLWVSNGSLSAFCSGLVTLERTLKGETVLTSISPNELVLRIFAANSRGTLAVEGSIGYSVFVEKNTFWHSISFEFEPSQLSFAVLLPWVQKYATPDSVK